MKNSFLKSKHIAPLFSLVLFLAVWQFISGFYNPVIVPSPIETWHSFFSLAVSGLLWEQGRQTIIRGFAGFGLAVLAGTPLGFLIGLNQTAASLFQPLVVVLQVTPLISWLLLAMIWIGFSRVPLFVVFITTLPLIIINTIQGIKSVDLQLLQMAGVFRVDKLRIIREVYFPQVIPYLFAGLAAALGTTWRAVAMAELLSVNQGVGAGMAVARTNLETAALFAWTIFLIILGLLTDRLLSYLSRQKLNQWK
ncbi:MAG: Binding-protein-dependent transport systems inner membrane component [Desulfotomaculum sp. 46_296]|nr:MAG: Binding-protein-dependent transport systems inner membrane component [Desulfotomaculum sp. 46_296]HAU32345.1 ABC transporter permease [Desulfotomaculum sp.]